MTGSVRAAGCRPLPQRPRPSHAARAAVCACAFGLAIAFVPAFAQSTPKPAPPAKKPAPAASAASAGGAMMDQDQLRACLTRQKDLQARVAALNDEQIKMDGDYKTLIAERDGLKDDLGSLDRTNAEAVYAFNARREESETKIGAWNDRKNKALDDVQAYDEDKSAWARECGGRRYREEDEAAVKRGQ